MNGTGGFSASGRSMTTSTKRRFSSSRSIFTAVLLSFIAAVCGDHRVAAAQKGLSRVMNSINVIQPYKYHGMWVFDDPAAGLVREPFVSGIDTIIDRVVAGIPDAADGFILVFSKTPFPGHELRLDWRREDGGGNWYFTDKLQMEGWLCPALFKYFDSAPRNLYVQVKRK